VNFWSRGWIHLYGAEGGRKICGNGRIGGCHCNNTQASSAISSQSVMSRIRSAHRSFMAGNREVLGVRPVYSSGPCPWLGPCDGQHMGGRAA
jgi:hypothetical protein